MKIISNIIDTLHLQRHRSTTRHTYYIMWKKFNQFIAKLDHKPTNWEDRLVLFTGYLVDRQFQSSTIRSYISAMRSVLSEINIWLSQSNYLLTSLTRACRLNNDMITTRLPIHKSLLEVLLHNIAKYFENKHQIYLAILYKALFSRAYYRMFRVGELMMGHHAIQAEHVHVAQNKEKMLFMLFSSKTHTKADKPQLVKITSTPGTTSNCTTKSCLCPFRLLKDYFAFCPHSVADMEHFFCFQ